MGLFDRKSQVVDSGKWTGMESAGGLVATIEAPQVTQRLESAPKKISPRVDHAVMHEAQIADYLETAEAIGLSSQDIMVEEFRLFLSKHDIPTFNHQEVVSYMDDIAAKDNPLGYGWHWCPVRPKDAEVAMTFGRPSQRDYNHGNIKTPSSDFYESHQFQDWHNGGRGGWIDSSSWESTSKKKTVVNVESNVRAMQAAHDEMFQTQPTPRDWRKEPSPAYTRTLPLHESFSPYSANSMRAWYIGCCPRLPT